MGAQTDGEKKMRSGRVETEPRSVGAIVRRFYRNIQVQ
jgi:hypothetical protein